MRDKDDAGTPNPIAGRIKWVIGRGVSQSGNYLRQFIHLGFNQDEAGRQVYDGAWPIIAGRRIALNFRWAQPDGVLELYQAGSEGPQWWAPWDDKVRGLPARGILDRCMASRTCPKIIEHFGSAEVWALKLTPEWVGTDAAEDIPLPENVRRYYIPSTTHGGGVGGFNTSLPGIGLPPVGPACPGNNFGNARLPANPVPHTQTVNALRAHFRNWVMRGTPPPDSVWPRMKSGDLVEAKREAMGFPSIPSLSAASQTAPDNLIMPVLDYDWGPQFNYNDTSGVPSKLPPPIKRVLTHAGAAGRRRRQRAGRRAGGAARRAARNLSGLEHHRGRRTSLPPGPDLRLRRRHDPVREDPGASAGERRPAPVAGGALHGSRGLRRGGARGGGEGGRGGVPAAGGRRPRWSSRPTRARCSG